MKPTRHPDPVPEKWAWHHRVLTALQSGLDRNRDQETAGSELDTNDLADSATDQFDHDLALGILMHEQSALNEVSEALLRIRNGTYGICEETGAAIPADRLRAVPWTRYTKDVQDRLEKEGTVKTAAIAGASDVHGPLRRTTRRVPARTVRHKSKEERRRAGQA